MVILERFPTETVPSTAIVTLVKLLQFGRPVVFETSKVTIDMVLPAEVEAGALL